MFSLLKDIDEYTIFSDIDYIKRDNKNVYLGLRIGEDIKPIKLTLEAFKVYGFLCFSVAFDCDSINDDELSCQMSNKRVIEACLRHSNPCVSDSSLKKLVIAAINELVKLRLIEKIANQSNGHYQANSYRLCPKSEWLKNLTTPKTYSKPCSEGITDNKGVVKNNYYEILTTPSESENLTVYVFDTDLGVVQESINRNHDDLLDVSTTNKNRTTPKMDSNQYTTSVTDNKGVVQTDYYEIITTSTTPEPTTVYSVESDSGVVQIDNNKTWTTLSESVEYTAYMFEDDLGVVQNSINNKNDDFSEVSTVNKNWTAITEPVKYTPYIFDPVLGVVQENEIIEIESGNGQSVDDVSVVTVIESVELKEGECLVKCLATQEQWVTQLKNTRKLAVPNKNEITVKVIDCHDTELVGTILLGFKKGCEPVELTTSEKMGNLLQIFTNRVKIPEIDYAEGDTANEDEKNENSSVYNNNINIINYNNTSNIDISIDTNQQDLELQDNNIFIDITPENIKKNNNKILRAHTQAHTHTREDENQEQPGKTEKDGQEEIEIEVEIKPPEPEKPKSRKCYLDASDQSRLAVIFNEHKPKHWNPLKLARHERRQLESYLWDEYRDGGIDELFKDIEDALEWCKLQSYWEANKGGLHSLLYRDNFVKWSQNYQEHKKPLLNATLDTANRTNGYDNQTTQTDNNTALIVPPPVAIPEQQIEERTPEQIKWAAQMIAAGKKRKLEIWREAEKIKRDKREYQWYLERQKEKEKLNPKPNPDDENPDDKKSA